MFRNVTFRLLRIILVYFIVVGRATTTESSTSELRAVSGTAATDDDVKFQNFLTDVMTNYSSWLSSRDPFSGPIAETVHIVHEILDVKMDLKITNQSMAGHSKTSSQTTFVNSTLASKHFSIWCTISYVDYLTFRGEYTVSGRMNDTGLLVPFQGEGKWMVASNFSDLTLIVQDYEITEDGYIDLSQANIVYENIVSRREDEFQGLELVEHEDDVNATDYKDYIAFTLAHSYILFLSGTFLDDIPAAAVPPPKVVVLDYLSEIFRKTKLKDILADPNPTTTTGNPNSAAPETLRAIQLFILISSCIITFVLN